MRDSVRAGAVVTLDRVDCIIDGLRVKRVGETTFEVVRRMVDDIVTLPDERIFEAMLWIMSHAKLVVEGAAAAPVGALLDGLVKAAGRSQRRVRAERRQRQPRSAPRVAVELKPPWIRREPVNRERSRLRAAHGQHGQHGSSRWRVNLPRSKPIRIGISACLLGQEVRFDGGHKRDPFLTDTLGAQVEWVPVCPEVEMGLGTPRETLRLVRARSDARRAMLPSVSDGHDAHRDRSHRRHEPLGGPAARAARARRAGPLRLRAQEGLAELRHGARQDL